MSLSSLTFVSIFVALCGMALVRHPVYGLLAYLAAFYVHPPSRWWGQGALLDVRWSLVAAGVTLVAVLIHQRGKPAKPFFKHSIVLILVLFVVWIAIQSEWALAPEKHADLVEMYAKFTIAAYLIYRSLDSEKNIRLFLWGHVLGCLFLSWLAFSEYQGGRFNDFGGPGISDANSAANQLVTGILVGASLFLVGGLRGKLTSVGVLPFIVNAMVATGSRSGFLAFGVGGLLYNLFAPKKSRRFVLVLSVLGVILVLMLTGPTYWQRIATIKVAGQNIEGVDTGGGRWELLIAQTQMSKEYPMGCGHRCTGVLASSYLDKKAFEGLPPGVGRTSHNTFMTLLVEQGWPGALFYLVIAIWTARNILSLWRQLRHDDGPLATLLPGVASVLGAIFVGDLFVDFLKHEVRIWFFAVLMAMANLHALARHRAQQQAADASQGVAEAGPGSQPALAQMPGR